MPFGLPGNILISAHGIQFLMRDEVVVILMELNHQSRTVYMNVEHPKNLPPSWLGNSVGHWEGDTLVIDTIGYTDQSSLVSFVVLNSEKLHTVERYRLTDHGRKLEGQFFYEDPETLTSPWKWSRTLYPSTNQEAFPQEAICQGGGTNRPYPISTRETEPLG